MINAMTVDVEDYFHVAAFSQAIRREKWDSMECRVERNTHRILEIFDQAGIKATFFVLGWVARRSPRLVRMIQDLGHEIASHGMSHELVFRQSRTQFAQETRDAKLLLEDTVGRAILGYRASTYSITRKSLWALDVLSEMGFAYDSSIFPIRHDTYGIPDALDSPGVVTGPEGRQIVEFPMTVATLFGARIPVSGGGYFRLLPYLLTRAGLRQINREAQRPFVFYLHPWEIDPQQPRVNARWLSRFRHYTNLHRCEGRLRRLLGEFHFAPMAEVLRDMELLPAAPGRVGMTGENSLTAR